MVYDRLGGSTFDDLAVEPWNLWCQNTMNKDVITKEGIGKNKTAYHFAGWLWMYRYAVSAHPTPITHLDSLLQTLTDRYYRQKHMYDSDEGDRVGAGATHIFTATELLGLEDPVVKEVVTAISHLPLTLICCSVLAQMTGKQSALLRQLVF